MAAINGGGVGYYIPATPVANFPDVRWVDQPAYDPKPAAVSDAHHYKDYNLNLYNSQVGTIPFRIIM